MTVFLAEKVRAISAHTSSRAAPWRGPPAGDVAVLAVTMAQEKRLLTVRLASIRASHTTELTALADSDPHQESVTSLPCTPEAVRAWCDETG